MSTFLSNVRKCPGCGGFKRFDQPLYCKTCRKTIDSAHSTVSRAIKDGKLRSLRNEEIACNDCGKRAHEYDHRDYAKPLEVEALCRSCNRRRPPAIVSSNMKTPPKSEYRRRFTPIQKDRIFDQVVNQGRGYQSVASEYHTSRQRIFKIVKLRILRKQNEAKNLG